MLFNFNIIDESIDDVPVTKEQVAAEIKYDIDKKPITSFHWLLCSIADSVKCESEYNKAITELFRTITGENNNT